MAEKRAKAAAANNKPTPAHTHTAKSTIQASTAQATGKIVKTTGKTAGKGVAKTAPPTTKKQAATKAAATKVTTTPKKTIAKKRTVVVNRATTTTSATPTPAVPAASEPVSLTEPETSIENVPEVIENRAVETANSHLYEDDNFGEELDALLALVN